MVRRNGPVADRFYKRGAMGFFARSLLLWDRLGKFQQAVQAFGKTLSVGADAAPATEIDYFIDKCDGAAIPRGKIAGVKDDPLKQRLRFEFSL